MSLSKSLVSSELDRSVSLSLLVLNDLWIVENLLLPLRAVLAALGVGGSAEAGRAGDGSRHILVKTHAEPEFGSLVSM